MLAVVLGSAINQDGRSNGLTAPNGTSQRAVLRTAVARAQIEPQEVGYVEAHGTGTSLGDPIELAALSEVYGRERKDGPCLVGSVKTNVGHLEAAAGIAGLIKATLSVSNGELPPHLHLKKLNSKMRWEGSGLEVCTSRRPWKAERRIAGVSSFGFGGTNAHVIVASANVPEAKAEQRPLHAVCLSGRTPAALQEVARRLPAYLTAHPELGIEEIALTANAGRAHLAHRMVVLAESREVLETRLRALGQLEAGPYVIQGMADRTRPKKVAFLFTGQGSQFPEMGRVLYETSSRFNEVIDRCDQIASPLIGRSLKDLLIAPEMAELLSQTRYQQPALFALELGLAELWRAYGIRPEVVAGHSLGEIVAACFAGVFSLEDALKLVCERGRLMYAQPAGGGMLACSAEPELLKPALERAVSAVPGVEVSARNSPRDVVLGGRLEKLEQVKALLERDGVTCTALKVSHAFHTALMEGALDPFEAVAKSIKANPPQIPVISNLTGALYEVGKAPPPGYWRRHLREPVDFAAGMKTLAGFGVDAVIELGAQPHLTRLAKATVGPVPNLRWLSSMAANKPAWTSLLTAVAMLHADGHESDWEGVDLPYARRRVALPTYPYERSRHWFTPTASHPTDAVAALRPAATEESHMNDKNAPNGLPTDVDGLRTTLSSTLELLREQSLALQRLSAAMGAQGQPLAEQISRQLDTVTQMTAAPMAPHAAPSMPAPAAQPMPSSRAGSRSLAKEVLAQISAICGFPASEIPPNARLGAELGFDSLMKVELDRKIIAALPQLANVDRTALPEDPRVEDLLAVFEASLGESGHPVAPAAPVAMPTQGNGGGSMAMAPVAHATQMVAPAPSAPAPRPTPRNGAPVHVFQPPEVSAGGLVQRNGAASVQVFTAPEPRPPARNGTPLQTFQAPEERSPRNGVNAVPTQAQANGWAQPETAPSGPVQMEWRLEDFAEYQELEKRVAEIAKTGSNPYGRIHETRNGAHAELNGRKVLNFASFNYLGLSNDPQVCEATKRAIDRYGTSPSATPLLFGETPLHHELEAEIASFLGTEAGVAFASGHATAVATIGHMFGPPDLIVHDQLIHDSTVRGCLLSGAKRRPFKHNDWEDLDRILASMRGQYRRALVVIEGVYSQDGDIPNLPKFIEVKKRHRAMLMIDEAHSIGVLGRHGAGIGDLYGVDRKDVDIWMGTLSKGLASCGGYIAGTGNLIRFLKLTTPLLIFSTGITPANAAAALASIRTIRREPGRVARVQRLSKMFLEYAHQKGLDTGIAGGSSIVPIIVGEWGRAIALSHKLLDRGINVMPIGYPAVAKNACRLRFFINADHQEDELRGALDALAEEIAKMGGPVKAASTGNGAVPDGDPTQTWERKKASRSGTPATLVLGSTGFIGRRLAEILSDRGENVRAIVRRGSDRSHLDSIGVDVREGSLDDLESLRSAMQGVKRVYNCAGLSTDWAPWEMFHASNVKGVENLLAAAEEAGGVERLLHLSTSDVYGYPTKACDESTQPRDIGLPYNKSKVLGEEVVRNFVQRGRLPITLFRPVTVFGPRSKDWVLEMSRVLLKKQMVMFDGGKSHAGLIYVDNLVEAMIAAAQSPNTVGQSYNMRDSGDQTWRDYVGGLCMGLGAPGPKISIPSRLALGVAKASEVVYGGLKMQSRPLMTRHSVFLLSRDQGFPIEKARRDFNFTPAVSYEYGLENTLSWLGSPEGKALLSR